MGFDNPRRQYRVGLTASREHDVRSVSVEPIPGDIDLIACNQPGMGPLFLILGVLAVGYPETTLSIVGLYHALMVLQAWRWRSGYR